MVDHLHAVRRAGLYVRMGGGKTGAVLWALRFAHLFDDTPILIVAPKRVARKTWPDEAQKWIGLEHMTVTPIMGTETERFTALGNLQKGGLVFSTNYEQIPWLVTHFGRNWPFKVIVADESTKLKGFRTRQGTKRTQSLAKVAHAFANRFILLSGTPSPNGIKDLWGQLWFLDHGVRLGNSFDAFEKRWFYKSHDGYGIVPHDHSQAQVQNLISDLCLTIDPADYIELDDVIESDIVVSLPPKARALYQDMERRAFMEIEQKATRTFVEIEAANAAVKTNKCLQIAAGAVYTDDKQSWEAVHDEKLDALDEIVEEACGAPVLVSYIFNSDLQRILQRFPQARALDHKPATQDAWNRGEIPILCAHPASAGHGLDLQHGGNIIADFTSGWDLEHDDQIVERIGPMRQFQSGYDRPVYRYRIMAERTMDYLVRDRRTTKRSVQDILMEALKRRNQ